MPDAAEAEDLDAELRRLEAELAAMPALPPQVEKYVTRLLHQHDWFTKHDTDGNVQEKIMKVVEVIGKTDPELLNGCLKLVEVLQKDCTTWGQFQSRVNRLHASIMDRKDWPTEPLPDPRTGTLLENCDVFYYKNDLEGPLMWANPLPKVSFRYTSSYICDVCEKPMTFGYQAVDEANVRDKAAGGNLPDRMGFDVCFSCALQYVGDKARAVQHRTEKAWANNEMMFLSGFHVRPMTSLVAPQISPMKRALVEGGRMTLAAIPKRLGEEDGREAAEIHVEVAAPAGLCAMLALIPGRCLEQNAIALWLKQSGLWPITEKVEEQWLPPEWLPTASAQGRQVAMDRPGLQQLRFLYSERSEEGDGLNLDDDDSCGICLESLEQNLWHKQVVTTKCGHHFHHKCLLKCKEYNGRLGRSILDEDTVTIKCPLCRMRMCLSDLKQLGTQSSRSFVFSQDYEGRPIYGDERYMVLCILTLDERHVMDGALKVSGCIVAT